MFLLLNNNLAKCKARFSVCNRPNSDRPRLRVAAEKSLLRLLPSELRPGTVHESHNLRPPETFSPRARHNPARFGSLLHRSLHTPLGWPVAGSVARYVLRQVVSINES